MIEPNTIKNLPENLTSISAGHNQLKFGWYLLEMLALKNLRFLNVSNMYSIENPFRQPWTVTCDDKHDQRPNRTPEGLVPCSNIVNTKDTFNFEFLDGKVIMHMPPKLETLVIDNCIIRETAVSEHLEQKFKSLKILQANRNFVPHFQDFDYSNALQEVYLSRSFVSWFEDSFFLTSNLTVLDLSYNDLYHYFSTERSRQLLQKQEYLTNLNLASNRFEHVPSDLFKGLSKLNVLNLTENELTEVDFALNDLTELRVLDLSKNRIRTLTKSKMHDLDILSRKTTLSLNLTGNVLLCSCETLDFLKWMRNKRRIHSKLILANFKNYSCSFVNSTTMYFSEISSIILDLDKQCSSKLGYIIVSSGAVVIFMCCIVSGILYRYRWKLRYLYHMTRRSLRGYFTLQDTKGSARKYYEFDAFISYAEEDSEFSYNTLKSEILNLDPSVRLCYHQEHFVPGSNICENIVNAVHCSRKTICVVSKHFMESQWCKYEFNMAHMEKIHNRGDQNSLLFLMLGDIKSDYVPATMMVYLQSESYLKVPGNKEDSVTFWNHVYNAIIEE
ncbi:hypothetical protein FSP39_025483 [Pinctada imbricata]|uniref:TIR domain-containing protein n=1 Tax=Pinctada imbricata TaxID=66713 RepID=A0AA88XK97_PINIB|nr:hypothetical protein FSP39_025483 [Pinctada imbricata]